MKSNQAFVTQISTFSKPATVFSVTHASIYHTISQTHYIILHEMTVFSSLLTFIIKPIYPVNAGALMIASQQEKIFWVFNFVG